jgi:hypothetical protein
VHGRHSCDIDLISFGEGYRQMVATESGTGLVAEVIGGLWRWLSPEDNASAGTAIVTPDGLLLIDPPMMPPSMHDRASRVAGVMLTSVANARDAASWRAQGVPVWAPIAAGEVAPEIVNYPFDPDHPPALPGDIRVGTLPIAGVVGDAVEVAYLWNVALPPGAGVPTSVWTLATGASFPVAAQTPYFDDAGAVRTVEGYLDLVRALQALAPDVILPSIHAPLDATIARSTGYAGHIGRPSHANRAAPVDGPRLVVGPAKKVLRDALAAPVIRRRAEASDAPWVADPWACIACGSVAEPLAPTCGGPPIPRLCQTCRLARRAEMADFRVMVCGGGCCTREGARAVVSALRREINTADMARAVDVVPVSCIGECSIGPFVRVANARGVEPSVAARLREALSDRARDLADETGEKIDADSEAVLTKWIPMVVPAEGALLARDLIAAMRDARE